MHLMKRVEGGCWWSLQAEHTAGESDQEVVIAGSAVSQRNDDHATKALWPKCYCLKLAPLWPCAPFHADAAASLAPSWPSSSTNVPISVLWAWIAGSKRTVWIDTCWRRDHHAGSHHRGQPQRHHTLDCTTSIHHGIKMQSMLQQWWLSIWLGERTIKHSDTSLCDLDTSICEETLNIGELPIDGGKKRGSGGRKQETSQRCKEISFCACSMCMTLCMPRVSAVWTGPTVYNYYTIWELTSFL
jgi:hypothetical protein